MGIPTGRLIATLWVQQLLMVVIVSGLLWWSRPVSAYSVLIGGLIYWLPNAYFTLRAFRYKGARSAMLVVRNMYQGGAGKFLLTAVSFAIAFIFVKPLDVLTLFAVYIGLIASQWVLTSRW